MKNWTTTLKRLLREHHSPAQLAAASFVGTLIGVSPFFGLHLLLSIIAGFILRLNKVMIYAVANISNPLFAPFIIFISYQIGSFILTGSFELVSFEEFKQSAPTVLGYWLLGSLVLGVSLGGLIASFVFMIARRLAPVDHFARACRKIGAKFLKFGGFSGYYARYKCRIDPVYRRLMQLIEAQQSILDIGGGQGFVPLLHSVFHHTSVKHLVIDHDDTKLSQGRQVAKAIKSSARFHYGDAISFQSTERYDAVCLIDVLHYLPADKQNAVVEKAISYLNPNACLYIRDMDKTLRARTALNKLQEHLSLLFGLSKATSINPRRASELEAFLAAKNFDVRVEASSASFIFSNVLLIARPKN